MSEEAATISRISKRTLAVRFVWAMAFLIPTAYVAQLLDVTAHETLGHGVSAILLGGRFTHFIVRPDTMGYASTNLGFNAPLWKQVFVLSAGVSVEALTGLILLPFALRLKQAATSLVLLVVTMVLFVNGAGYLFFSVLHPVPPADFARIVWMVDAPCLRPVLLAVGGLGLIGAVAGMTVAIWRRLEGWLGDSCDHLRGIYRAIALLPLAALPAAAWLFLLDWNELSPGIGRMPNFAGAGIHLMVVAALFWFRPRPVLMSSSRRAIVFATGLMWAITIAIVLTTALWLRHGVAVQGY